VAEGRKQTEEIIQKILDHFPDTGKLASRPSKSSELISLNLNPQAELEWNGEEPPPQR
jgi:hypothetical protein